MADQLANGGHPDPRLTVVAHRLLTAASAWQDDAGSRLGWASTTRLAEDPLDVAASRARDAATAWLRSRSRRPTCRLRPAGT